MHIPRILTLLRLFLSPLLLVPLIVLQAPAMVTLVVYVLLIATDFFDGYYARTLRQTSSEGAFLDQFADKIFLFSVIFATLYMHLVPLSFAMLLGFRELAVMGMREYGLQKNIALPVIYAAKLKTAFQMMFFGWVLAGSPLIVIMVCLFIVTSVLSYYSAYCYLKRIMVQDHSK